MSIYYISLAIIDLDHSEDLYLAVAGLTDAIEVFAGADVPSKIPLLQAKTAEFWFPRPPQTDLRRIPQSKRAF